MTRPSARILTRAALSLLVLAMALSGCNFSAPEPTPKPVATVPGATFTPIPKPPTATLTPPPPPTATLEPTVPPPTATTEPAAVTANDVLNVRNGPGTDYTRIGQLDAGQKAPAVGRNADSTWWQILFEGGPDGKGWVLGQYVTVNASAASLPVVEAPPPPPTNPPPPPTQLPAATATNPPPVTQYGVPQLESPEDEAQFHGEGITIILSWQSVGALQPGDCYKVRIIHADGIFDSECVTGTSWTVQGWLFDYRPADRGLLWSLRVVRESDGTQLSPWSATWVFYWFGG